MMPEVLSRKRYAADALDRFEPDQRITGDGKKELSGRCTFRLDKPLILKRTTCSSRPGRSVGEPELDREDRLLRPERDHGAKLVAAQLPRRRNQRARIGNLGSVRFACG